MFKTANVGSADRIVRIIAGIVLAALPFMLENATLATPLVKWAMVLVGLVLITTALVRFCPLYRVVGASTCSVTNT